MWALIATLLGWLAFGRPVLGGIIASPFIGLAAGYSSRFFPSTGRVKRAIFALVSLCIAACLFGASIGAFAVLTGELSGNDVYQHPSDVLIETTLASLFGMILGPYVLLLWPLSYANHSIVSKLWTESG